MTELPQRNGALAVGKKRPFFERQAQVTAQLFDPGGRLVLRVQATDRLPDALPAFDFPDPLENGVARADLQSDDFIRGEGAGAVSIATSSPEKQAAGNVPDLGPDTLHQIVRLDQAHLDKYGAELLAFAVGALQRADEALQGDQACLEEELTEAVVTVVRSGKHRPAGLYIDGFFDVIAGQAQDTRLLPAQNGIDQAGKGRAGEDPFANQLDRHPPSRSPVYGRGRSPNCQGEPPGGLGKPITGSNGET